MFAVISTTVVSNGDRRGGRRRRAGQSSLTGCPPRASNCRDNMQSSVAPRRLLGATPTLVREYLLVGSGSWASVSLGCQPGSYESAPFFAWSVPGSPPFSTVQVATDPESPKGGSQRACPTRGAHPTASGRLSTVALFKQSYPALAVWKRSLWDASPGDTSEPPFNDRSLGRRPSVTLFQRGSASANTVD